MKREIIECDVCGKTKGETNHWYMAFAHGGDFAICTWEQGAKATWNGPAVKHICGQECAQKFLSNWMNEQK